MTTQSERRTFQKIVAKLARGERERDVNLINTALEEIQDQINRIKPK